MYDCSPTANPEVMVLNIGHRGAPRQAPENTLTSFHRALELGADGLELDVHLTRDGHVVVIHDRLLDRTTNGIGPVDEMDLADLKRLDAGAHFSEGFQSERIPTLDEVFTTIPYGPEIQIELKGLTAGLVHETVRLIENRRTVDQVIVTSFVHTLIRSVKELNSSIRTGALMTPSTSMSHAGYTIEEFVVGLTRAAGADVILSHHTTASRHLFDLAERTGLTTGAWTVDDPAEINRMIELGASRITSNVPDVVTQMLKRGGQSNDRRDP